ncbi:hypothetical protein [Xanthovirga aplysinae]|uniref:hypothetical protein n=1 Tax=Xanthovirga aplysinae TaxID=2529853 RepID=UPI0012BC7D19|nr:hypothetical protein [Xanthovirga aplysinae]MTI31153.1 hypothetical protein [Xanthovirga aplysinae]
MKNSKDPLINPSKDPYYQQLVCRIAPVVTSHFLTQAEKDFKKIDKAQIDYQKIAEVTHQLAEEIYSNKLWNPENKS